MTSLRTMVLICAAMTLGTAGVASAQDANGDGMDDVTGQPVAQVVPPTDVVAPGAYPISMAQRPLTLASGTLAIGDGGPQMVGPVFSVTHISVCVPNPLGGPDVCGSDTGVGLILGASYGITDDLQVDGRVLPLQLSPDADYGNARLGATFRFVRGNVEVGARAGVTLINADKRRVGLDIGVPLDLHIGDNMRLATGATLNIGFYDKARVGLEIPLIFEFNVTPNVALGLWSGLQIVDFDGAGDNIVVPLRIFGGYTVADDQNRPMLDVGGYFGFPLFINSAPGGGLTADIWELGVYARFHLFM